MPPHIAKVKNLKPLRSKAGMFCVGATSDRRRAASRRQRLAGSKVTNYCVAEQAKPTARDDYATEPADQQNNRPSPEMRIAHRRIVSLQRTPLASSDIFLRAFLADNSDGKRLI
jgi:hypothetical protein